MPSRIDQRAAIQNVLAETQGQPLAESGRRLFAELGYMADRRLPIATVRQFADSLDPNGTLTDRERESLAELKSLHLLFQLTGAELHAQRELFDDGTEPTLFRCTRSGKYDWYQIAVTATSDSDSVKQLALLANHIGLRALRNTKFV